MRSAPRGGYSGQSAVNQDAADGGYWHQRHLVESLRRWRASALGARLALALFGPAAARARSIGAEPMEDPSCKPDLRVWMLGADGSRAEAHVSAKLARLDSTSSSARPMHHAGRARFEEAHLHGLLPEDDLAARAALLAHFLDGEPLARQGEPGRSRALAFLRGSWGRVAACALSGLSHPKADWIAISLARVEPDGSLTVVETRAMRCERAVEHLAAEPPELSEPRDGQVGTIGGRLMHIQRGQALSLGEQRDIQIKINAGALFEAAPELPHPPKRTPGSAPGR